jgi:pSer/pThr/pTyr-binding forkhead associated (FHA) protein
MKPSSIAGVPSQFDHHVQDWSNIMNTRIQVVSGPFSGRTFEISRGKLIVGREEDCHLRLESEIVSRHHCAHLRDDYTLRIRDLGSKSGT